MQERTRGPRQPDSTWLPAPGPRQTAERALMYAVLEDALQCLAGNARPANERLIQAARARAWIERRDRDWLFSFDNVCESLDLEPERLRARLLAAGVPVPRDRKRFSRSRPRRTGAARAVAGSR